ncbi:MAG: sigma-54 dependent transcriptional regulator [Methylococcales bacterium]|nr:sigma-54 dependent transcriptional regulator [Methylococcales bacterium]MDD5754440.1 sigma-54 dependent transcriptional regulator [Methylococcales bacterium]
MNNFETVIGQSPTLETLIRSAKIVAATDVTVLLKGETGTGKEVFAHAIKNASSRANKEFLTLNCAALPESLIESELFGHKKGSFTGAVHNTQGLLQAADGGTLFLDEINSLPLSIQAKLLRFLDSGECLAVGDVRPYKVDVRVIAATNMDLMVLIANGVFRSDLYFRLNVVPFELPPLSERSEDIELLIAHFFKLFEKNHGIKAPKFSKASLRILKHFKWSGNIRELRNLCERLSILFSDQLIEPEHLPVEFQDETNQVETHDFILPSVGLKLDALEANLITQALDRTKGNRSKSARLLGITRDTLLYRMQKHGFFTSSN